MKKSILFFSVCFVLSSTFIIQNCCSQWVQVPDGMGSNNIYSFAPSGNYIFAGTGGGVYRSSNNGTNWLQCGLNNNVSSLAANGSNIFAVRYGEVWLSRNYGDNWARCLQISSWYPVICIAVNGSYIFAGVEYLGFAPYSNGAGVYRSTNNGQNWIICGLGGRSVYSLGASGSNVFAGVGEGNCRTHRSTDYGDKWQCSLNSLFVISFAFNGSNIFAGTEGQGVYRSTNIGVNWTQTTLNYGIVFSVATSDPQVFAGTNQNGVFFSTNYGGNWVQKNEGFNILPTVNALLIANGYVFAGTQSQSVWRRPMSDFVGIKPVNKEEPVQFDLYQNYPNPFNPATNIVFAMPKSGDVRITVFDVLGREVAVLVNEKLKAGTYEVDWNGSNFSSGVYYYRITINDFMDVKKMILIK